MTNACAYPQRIMLTSDTVGGVWHYTLELTRQISDRASVAIVTVGPEPSDAQMQDAQDAGAALVDATRLPLDWIAAGEDELLWAASDLQRRAALWKADIVHLHAPAYAGRTRWSRPLVVHAHSCLATWWAAAGDGAMPPDFEWRSALTARGMALANSVIAPSKSFARELTHAYGPELRITVIRNGVEPIPQVPLLIPSEFMLTAGRLWDRGKNISILDKVARTSGLQIFAAGPLTGPRQQSVVLPHLWLLGNLKADVMSRWHAKAGVFISPSKYEPFGLAVLEAAQARTALVLSDIPTFRELWDGAALFFDPDDAQGLAEILMRLRASPSARAKLAHAAWVRSRLYGADSMGAKISELYQSILSRFPRPVLAEGGVA